MNIGKMIDKRLGAKREVIGIKKRGDVEEAKKRGTTFTQAEANRNNKTGNRSIFFTFTKLLFLYFNN